MSINPAAAFLSANYQINDIIGALLDDLSVIETEHMIQLATQIDAACWSIMQGGSLKPLLAIHLSNLPADLFIFYRKAFVYIWQFLFTLPATGNMSALENAVPVLCRFFDAALTFYNGFPLKASEPGAVDLLLDHFITETMALNAFDHAAIVTKTLVLIAEIGDHPGNIIGRLCPDTLYNIQKLLDHCQNTGMPSSVQTALSDARKKAQLKLHLGSWLHMSVPFISTKGTINGPEDLITSSENFTTVSNEIKAALTPLEAEQLLKCIKKIDSSIRPVIFETTGVKEFLETHQSILQTNQPSFPVYCQAFSFVLQFLLCEPTTNVTLPFQAQVLTIIDDFFDAVLKSHNTLKSHPGVSVVDEMISSYVRHVNLAMSNTVVCNSLALFQLLSRQKVGNIASRLKPETLRTMQATVKRLTEPGSVLQCMQSMAQLVVEQIEKHRLAKVAKVEKPPVLMPPGHQAGPQRMRFNLAPRVQKSTVIRPPVHQVGPQRMRFNLAPRVQKSTVIRPPVHQAGPSMMRFKLAPKQPIRVPFDWMILDDAPPSAKKRLLAYHAKMQASPSGQPGKSPVSKASSASALKHADKTVVAKNLPVEKEKKSDSDIGGMSAKSSSQEN